MGLTSADMRRVIWTFTQAFLATFLTLAVGWLNAPNTSNVKAAVVAALVAAVAAGLSAVKNAFLEDGSTLK